MESGLSWSECTGGGKNRTPIQFILSVSYLTPKRRPVAERLAARQAGRSVERGLLHDGTRSVVCISRARAAARSCGPDDAGLGGVCESPDDIAWLACNPGYEKLVLDAEQDFFSPGIEMVVAPGVEMPRRGALIEVTGHYDDPAASDCAFGDDPEERVLFCRAQFVVTDARRFDR